MIRQISHSYKYLAHRSLSSQMARAGNKLKTRSANVASRVQKDRLRGFRAKVVPFVQKLNPTSLGWRVRKGGTATFRIDMDFEEERVEGSRVLDQILEIINPFPFLDKPHEELSSLLQSNKTITLPPSRIFVPVSVSWGSEKGLITRVIFPPQKYDYLYWSFMVGWIFSIPEHVGLVPTSCEYEYDLKAADYPIEKVKNPADKYTFTMTQDVKRFEGDLEQVTQLLDVLFRFYPAIQNHPGLHYLIRSEIFRLGE